MHNKQFKFRSSVKISNLTLTSSPNHEYNGFLSDQLEWNISMILFMLSPSHRVKFMYKVFWSLVLCSLEMLNMLNKINFE